MSEREVRLSDFLTRKQIEELNQPIPDEFNELLLTVSKLSKTSSDNNEYNKNSFRRVSVDNKINQPIHEMNNVKEFSNNDLDKLSKKLDPDLEIDSLHQQLNDCILTASKARRKE